MWSKCLESYSAVPDVIWLIRSVTPNTLTVPHKHQTAISISAIHLCLQGHSRMKILDKIHDEWQNLMHNEG